MSDSPTLYSFPVLDLTESDQAFAASVRRWLEQNLVGEYLEHRGVGGVVDVEAWDLRLRWERELAQAGWLGISWPREYGGRGGTPTQEVLFEMEYAAAAAPARANVAGHDLLAPALLQFGSEELKRRFLPRIAACEDIWAQGFSEPGAGSDLAAVSCRARLSGGQWIINGQKTWTSFAHLADWLFLLVRTETGSERHHGLSIILIRTDAPGVDIRPITNIAGQNDFCEVFLADATTPGELVLGEVGDGWRVAMGLLGYERGTTLLPMQMALDRELKEIIGLAGSLDLLGAESTRQGLMQAFIGNTALRWTAMRVLQPVLAGSPPGAESSVTKLLASTLHQQQAEMALDLVGLPALVADSRVERLQRTYLMSRAETIYGGSAEIQRTLIAERVLGLPR